MASVAIIELITALEPEVQAIVVALIGKIRKKKNPASAAIAAQVTVDEYPDYVDTTSEYAG